MLEKKGRKAKDLSEVVVWVEGPRVAPEPASATITMEKKRFEPHLVVVPVGGKVAFPNMDPILHNAFSVSGENRFDLELYKKPTSRSQTFEHPGVVRVYCNIHPQMSAFVVVRDNPFWAQARKDGRFSIAEVPRRDLGGPAWHARAGEVTEKVTVARGRDGGPRPDPRRLAVPAGPAPEQVRQEVQEGTLLREARVGLTQKILLFTGAMIVSLVGDHPGLHHRPGRPPRPRHHPTRASRRPARSGRPSRPIASTSCASGCGCSPTTPTSRPPSNERDEATTLDSLQERGMDLDADFMLATDWDGILVARTDHPGATGDDLSEDPLVVSRVRGRGVGHAVAGGRPSSPPRWRCPC